MDELTRILSTPEMTERRKRFHETFGEGGGYHWDTFSTIENYVKYLEESVATGVKQTQYCKEPRWDWDAIRKLEAEKGKKRQG